MYQYLDRDVLELGCDDQLLVWSIRQWVTAARSGNCACGTLHATWKRRGLEAALGDFHMAMSVFDSAGLGPLRFKHLACAALGDDEALLLSIFAAARTGEQVRAQGMVEQVVKPEARHTLLVAIGRLATAMPG